MSGDLRPTPTALSAPYWEAARRHELVLQRCSSCRRHLFHPRTTCPGCGGDQLTWDRASGYGVVHSFTVARRPTHSAFAEAGPMVIAIVELAEGPRLTTNIVDCDPAAVSIGMPVTVDYRNMGDVTLPVFRPVAP